MRTLAPGWNRITYDISPTSPDFPGGADEANEIILFVVAQNLRNLRRADLVRRGRVRPVGGADDVRL